jgi:transcriptional regulator with XRE-family HTH domain
MPGRVGSAARNRAGLRLPGTPGAHQKTENPRPTMGPEPGLPYVAPRGEPEPTCRTPSAVRRWHEMAIERGVIFDRFRLPAPEVRRQIRLDAGLTTDQMAELIGCKRRAVSYYEAGRDPEGEILTKYAAALEKLRDQHLENRAAAESAATGEPLAVLLDPHRRPPVGIAQPEPEPEPVDLVDLVARAELAEKQGLEPLPTKAWLDFEAKQRGISLAPEPPEPTVLREEDIGGWGRCVDRQQGPGSQLDRGDRGQLRASPGGRGPGRSRGSGKPHPSGTPDCRAHLGHTRALRALR